MTKRKYSKLCLILSIVIAIQGYLLLSPKLYNKLHRELVYRLVEPNTPNWISDWYK